MHTNLRATTPRPPFALLLLAMVACGGGGKDDPGPTGPGPSVATSISAVTPLSVEGAPGQPVTERPSVLVRDQRNAPMAGVTVTFAVAEGGGSLTGASPATDAAGVATVGSWTLGPNPGPNSLTATVGSLTPVTFAANATAPLAITAVSPDTLVPGGTMTITGSGFNGIIAQNLVRVDGTAASISAASATQLVATVPAGLGCGGKRNIEVTVHVGNNSASRLHPASLPDAGTVRALAPGQLLVLQGADSTRCNTLSNPGRYVISVFNSQTAYTSTGAAYELRGAAAAAAGTAPVHVAVPGPLRSSGLAPRVGNLIPGEEHHRDEQHLRLLEENIRFLNQNRAHLPRRGARRNLIPGEARAVAVGDVVPLRIPAIQRTGFCTNHQQISTRVAYVGPRSVIYEDVTNPLAGQMDDTWQAVGNEFESSMYDILTQNFGDPLVWDAQTSNKGRVGMVFSKYINDSIPGIAGFVVSCDLFDPANPVPSVPSSNFGAFFYAFTPTVPGELGGTANNPPNWLWRTRPTILHEVKHIVSFASRIANDAPAFEESWLEESTARLSEELYERRRYAFAQRANIGYGTATQTGPWCGVRACSGQPRGFVRAFEDLYTNFYQEPHRRSPLGRLNSNDFSFYNTGWSLTRWAADRSNMSEAAFFTALTQSTTSGLTNLQARAGRTFASMLPEWLLSMALDDRPGITLGTTAVNFPSWNLRDVFVGLNTDFPGTYAAQWPLAVSAVSYGNFFISSTVVPGTGSFAELSGTMASPQLLELRAAGGGPPPTQLGLAIVRIE
jgi:hypothetical protein